MGKGARKKKKKCYFPRKAGIFERRNKKRRVRIEIRSAINRIE
jgi:hypothetical protein